MDLFLLGITKKIDIKLFLLIVGVSLRQMSHMS